MQVERFWLKFGEPEWRRAAFAALLATAVLSAASALRGFEYDEAYTFFLTAGVSRPTWPVSVFRAGDLRAYFQAQAGLGQIADALRATDVHPPIYFWAIDLWRQFFGGGLFIARLFSVVCGLAALGAVARIARESRIPAIAAVLITLGCYGFTYTATVARGFALAQALSLWGVALALTSRRTASVSVAAIAGLLLGAATATNYLTVFVAGAVLLWLLTARSFCLFGSTLTGFSAFLPLDLWFFAAQHASRTGQFPPFAWLPGTIRLARCFAGALLGALPLYEPPPLNLLAEGLLGVFFLALIVAIIFGWRQIGDSDSRRLLALGAVSPAAGLLLLGLIFNNTPIEVRYLAFAMPFCALLLVGTAARGLLFGLACVQFLAIAGLLFRNETMQPARTTAAAAASLAGRSGLVLLPYGNDGVGVVGPFVAEAPGWLRILVVRPGMSQQDVAKAASGANHVVLALLTPDAASRDAIPRMLAAFETPCWRFSAFRGDIAALDRSGACRGG